MAQQSVGGYGGTVFDALDPSVTRHPQATYARLRASGPVQQAGVIVSGRAEIDEVLHDPQTYSSNVGRRFGNVRPLIPIELDPPAHARYRAALDPLFAPQRVNELGKQIQLVAQQLVEPLAEKTEVDFARQFSVPFATHVLMTLLGLPLEDLAWFLELKDGVVRPNRVLGKPMGEAEVLAYQAKMASSIYDYFAEALQLRETDRGDDLLGRLLDVEVDGAHLRREEILDICFLLVVAGIDPVSAALDCAFAYLAQHPDDRSRLVANPSSRRRVAEELLRWETPVMSVARTATRDTELGGCPVSAGQPVFALLGAANVDGIEWPDPEIVRWNRDVNRHLAFGAGIHRCLGSHLARLELRVALREWHARIPDYAVAPGAEFGYAAGTRTVDTLPMVISRSSRRTA